MLRLFSVCRFFSSESLLHPYLLQGLKNNNLLPLRPCQQKAIAAFSEGKNVVINQIDGSGKTLAYLLPVINRILHTKKLTPSPPKSGAIIVTLNKQLALSIYRQVRMLDFDNLLSVNRSGSITHYSPVVDEMCKKKDEQDEDLIIDMMYKNVSKSVVWPHTDILITTPQTLYKILSEKADNQEKISPEMIVVDDADLILSKKEDLSNYFNKNYKYIQMMSAKEGVLRHILATPFDNFLSSSNSFFQWKNFVSTDYSGANLINNKLKIYTINIKKTQSKQEAAAEKIEYLVKLLKKRLQKKVVIYCSSKLVDQVKLALKTKLDISPVQYYAKLSSEKRMAAIFDFNYKKSNVLITTELANRGFNFVPSIDSIISIQSCENAEDEIVRMGRSNQQGAEYIVMDEGKNTLSSRVSELKKNTKVFKFVQNLNIKELELSKQEEAQL